MLFGAASRPRPGGASIRREDEKRRLKTTDVASVRSPEIPPVREYGPRAASGRGRPPGKSSSPKVTRQASRLADCKS